MKIVTRAEIPDGLAQAWLQHLRDFDEKHPGCHFQVVARGEISTAEMMKMLQITPSFDSIAVIERDSTSDS
jgi:hypothetical protein